MQVGFEVPTILLKWKDLQCVSHNILINIFVVIFKSDAWNLVLLVSHLRLFSHFMTSYLKIVLFVFTLQFLLDT
ncbi:hypothetical protein Lalb_Chr06g0169001 [Lupinus albus]|uniref:Uncharacterized protein n=1 Tax=Lupinus albus TaxID=3870 RepID=A0A6A4QEM3_LUPAL|nr:hypothetical protein Lalb_Chr06g0169001 [Lupinus albus]